MNRVILIHFVRMEYTRIVRLLSINWFWNYPQLSKVLPSPLSALFARCVPVPSCFCLDSWNVISAGSQTVVRSSSSFYLFHCLSFSSFSPFSIVDVATTSCPPISSSGRENRRRAGGTISGLDDPAQKGYTPSLLYMYVPTWFLLSLHFHPPNPILPVSSTPFLFRKLTRPSWSHSTASPFTNSQRKRRKNRRMKKHQQNKILRQAQQLLKMVIIWFSR